MVTIIVSRTGRIVVDTNGILEAYAIANEVSDDEVEWDEDFIATDHITEEAPAFLRRTTCPGRP